VRGGRGCAHISRFETSFSPPSGAVDCGLPPVAVQDTGPAGGPDELVTVVTLTEASADRCALRSEPMERLREGKAVKEGGGGCQTAAGLTSAGSLLVGLAALLRRRPAVAR
jgi:hypothetical protein